MQRPPKWSYDEIAIVAAVAYRAEWQYLGPAHPEVQALSRILRSSCIHPGACSNEMFRNPNGVARKMSDIATQRPDYGGKPTRGGKMDIVVLEELLADPPAFLKKADLIRRRIDSSGPRAS